MISSLGGSVKLKSKNPFDVPLLDPGLLTTPFDVYTIIESVKSVHRFLAGPAWKGYIIKPFGGGANLVTDNDYLQFVRDFTTTQWHAVGTASMSAKGSSSGVLNPDLTVKGTTGLRVVDSSVFVSTGITFAATWSNPSIALYSSRAHSGAGIYHG